MYTREVPTQQMPQIEQKQTRTQRDELEISSWTPCTGVASLDVTFGIWDAMFTAVVRGRLCSLIAIIGCGLLPYLLTVFLAKYSHARMALSFAPRVTDFSGRFSFSPLHNPMGSFARALVSRRNRIAGHISKALSRRNYFSSLRLLSLRGGAIITLMLSTGCCHSTRALRGEMHLRKGYRLTRLPSTKID